MRLKLLSLRVVDVLSLLLLLLLLLGIALLLLLQQLLSVRRLNRSTV